jgi:hypothetical protein
LISRTTARFRRAFAALEPEVQERARHAYRVFRANPRHPGLRLKRVHPTRPVYSARIGLGYRALGLLEGDTMVWFWIGTHAEYERLLREG